MVPRSGNPMRAQVPTVQPPPLKPEMYSELSRRPLVFKVDNTPAPVSIARYPPPLKAKPTRGGVLMISSRSYCGFPFQAEEKYVGRALFAEEVLDASHWLSPAPRAVAERTWVAAVPHDVVVAA